MTNKKRTPQVGDVYHSKKYNELVYVLNTKNYFHAHIVFQNGQGGFMDDAFGQFEYIGRSQVDLSKLFKTKCEHEFIEQNSGQSEYEPSLVYFRGVCKKCGDVVLGMREQE